MPAPLVITLGLPEDVQARLDDERRHWFPAGRTSVGAHVTLFHAVPGDLEPDVRAALATEAYRALDARVTGVRSLGRGAAYTVTSPELVRRHRALQQQWWPHLTRQDQQPLHGHVTVQNKVDPATARQTVATLEAAFTPFDLAPVGFDLWRYDGGPWAHLARVPFPRCPPALRPEPR